MMHKILKNIAIIALAVCVAIGSFFVPLNSDKKLNAAHADNSINSYSFEGSSLITVATGYNSYSDCGCTGSSVRPRPAPRCRAIWPAHNRKARGSSGCAPRREACGQSAAPPRRNESCGWTC